MHKITSFLATAVVATLAFATNASASLFTGNYNYSITGQSSNPGCTTATPLPGDGLNDNFVSTSGSNSVSSDPVSFSICDGTTGFLEDGIFLITDGTGDSATGNFSGILTGNTLLDGTGGDIFNGTFIIVSATGTYLSDQYATGSFQDVTGAVKTAAFTSGTITFQQTPEPVSILLCGSGHLLLAGSRKFLYHRN